MKINSPDLSIVRQSHHVQIRLLLALLLLGLVASCSVAGGGGATSETDESSNPLYTGGPIDIPVPIAKAEAIDPKLVTVSISANRLSLTGQAGAVPNPTVSPQVWARDQTNDEIITATTRADGSFDTIEFTYDGSSVTTSIALAGFDGTNIGAPIFLKVTDNVYIWLLTNGSTVTDGTLTVEGNRVYLTTHESSSSTAISKPLPRQSSGITSSLYALNVGGTAEQIATGDISIDQVFVTNGKIIIRSGKDFYFNNSAGEFGLCCSIDTEQEITQVDVEEEPSSGIQIMAVSSQNEMFVCWRYGSLGECYRILAIEETQRIPYFQLVFFDSLGSTSVGDNVYVQVIVETTTGSGTTLEGRLFSWNGQVSDTLLTTQSGINYTVDELVTLDNGSTLFVTRALLKKGASGDIFSNLQPVTNASGCAAGSSLNGSEEMGAMMLVSSNGKNYLLDASLTMDTSTSPATLCSASKTRTIINTEAHPTGQLVIFCADDDNSNGQLYAFCAKDLNSSSVSIANLPTTGNVVQLTDGSEHCTAEKNWKVDRAAGTDGNASGSVVNVDLSNPSAPQIRFIDPGSDPLLADCLD